MGGDDNKLLYHQHQQVSIHAPRVGGDRKNQSSPAVQTPVSIHAPRVGGDRMIDKQLRGLIVSIHAPRVGGDTEVPAIAAGV